MKFKFDRQRQTDICQSVTKERPFYSFDVVKDGKVYSSPFLLVKNGNYLGVSLSYGADGWKGTIRKYDENGKSIIEDDNSFIPEDVLSVLDKFPDFTLNRHFVRDANDGCVYWKEKQIETKSEILDVCQFLAYCSPFVIETEQCPL